jgi:hypothetical protein
MSPEQAYGFKDRVDHRSDIWAVGVVLYLCSTGRYPFDGENYNQVLGQIITDFKPLAPRELNPAVSPELERIILRAISKDLAYRYSTAQEMASDLLLLAQPSAPSLVELSERLIAVGVEAVDVRTDHTLGERSGVPWTQLTPSGIKSEIPKTIITPTSVKLSTTTTPSVVPTGRPRTTAPRRLSPLVLVVGLLLAVGVTGGALMLAFNERADPTVRSTTEPLPNPTVNQLSAEPTETAPLSTPAEPEKILPTPLPVEMTKTLVSAEQQHGGAERDQVGDASVVVTPEEVPRQPPSFVPDRDGRSRARQAVKRSAPRPPIISSPPRRPSYGTKLPGSSQPTRPAYDGTKL